MRRHLTKDNRNSDIASKECSDSITVFWDSQFKNWVIYWRGQQVMELPRGESFNVMKIKRHIHNIKNNRLKDNLEKARRIREERKKKAEENKREMCREAAKDLQNGVEGDFQLTNRRGDRNIIIKGRKKKTFHYPNRR